MTSSYLKEVPVEHYYPFATPVCLVSKWYGLIQLDDQKSFEVDH
ncbi:hypothetical protein [Ammoniphilus sp. YIM 78166]|nr:hypothetical protein [Ammoniphilus sp. YIM 78166]